MCQRVAAPLGRHEGHRTKCMTRLPPRRPAHCRGPGRRGDRRRRSDPRGPQRAASRSSTKADASPVTEADHAAEAVILEQLARGRAGHPGDRRGSLRRGPSSRASAPSSSWSIRSTAPRNSSAAATISPSISALVRDRRAGGRRRARAGERQRSTPASPGTAPGRAHVADGVVAERRPIHVRAPGERPIDVVASKSHRTPETDAYIARYKVGELVSAGSSLKFCSSPPARPISIRAWARPCSGTPPRATRCSAPPAARWSRSTARRCPTGRAARRAPQAYRNPWFIAAGPIELVA